MMEEERGTMGYCFFDGEYVWVKCFVIRAYLFARHGILFKQYDLLTPRGFAWGIGGSQVEFNLFDVSVVSRLGGINVEV